MKTRRQRSDKGKQRKPYKHSQEAVQSNSEPIKEEMRDIIPVTDNKELTFEDLPKKLQDAINKIIEWRKICGLPDDSETRKQKAVGYYKWEMERKDADKTTSIQGM